MLAQRINKEIGDTSRVIVDMTFWLDASETITLVTPVNVMLGGPGWTTQQPIATPPATPYDPTPLTVYSTTIVNDLTGVQLFLVSGTPGNVYTVQFVVAGSSGRKITMEVGVQLVGPVYVPPNIAPAGSLPGFVPTSGNVVMTGPLYMFEDPLNSNEAATKNYVDTALFAGVPALPGAFRNRLKNGDFRIFQRVFFGGTTIAVASLNTKYTLDQWLVGCSGDTATASQGTGSPFNPSSTNGTYITISSGSSMTALNLSNRTESLDCADMVLDSVITVSGWFRVNNISMGLPFITLFTTAAVDDWSGSRTTIAGGGVVNATFAANEWVFFNNTFTISADATSGMELSFSFSNPAGNTVELANIQLERGAQYSAFEQRPYSVELSLCQRYYQVFGFALYSYGSTGDTIGVRVNNQGTMRTASPFVQNITTDTNTNYTGGGVTAGANTILILGTVTTTGAIAFVGNMSVTSEL